MSRAVLVRTVVGGLALALVVTLPAGAAVRRPSTVSLSGSDPSVLTGESVKLRGAVTPQSRRTVVLQRKDGDRWVKVRSTSTDTQGRYTFTLPAYATGTFAYRAYVTQTVRYADDTSRSVDVVVKGRGNPKAHTYLMGKKFRWDPCRTIDYRVNTRNAPAGWRRDIGSSLARISAQSGLKFRMVGKTRKIPGDVNHPNAAYPKGTDLMIAFVRPGQSTYLPRGSSYWGVGGANGMYTFTSGGAQIPTLYDGFVVIDKNLVRQVPTGFGTGPRYGWQGTRGQLFMHELGHAVGMGHAATATANKIQVMYPSMNRKLAAWGAGDAVNLRNLGAGGCIAARAARTKLPAHPHTTYLE